MRKTWLLVALAAVVGLLVSGTLPAIDVAAVGPDADPPTTQIRDPENSALIEAESGTVVTISGYAWDNTNEPGFPSDPVLDAINNDDGNGTYYVTWAAVAGALNYTLEESTSPFFDENVTPMADVTSPKFFTGKAPGTYYYRLMAHNVDGDSRWSNIESVEVLSTLSLAMGEAAPDAQLADLPIVEVSIDGGGWQSATVALDPSGWWSWTFDWTLPEVEDAVYTISARAKTTGDYGLTDTISVTLRTRRFSVYFPLVFYRWPPVPYPPTLNPIANEDKDGNYTLSWSYGSYPDVDAPTSFVIEEANNAAFTDSALYTVGGSTYTYNFTNKSSGTYYYRARGNNLAGPGEWSVTRSVLVQVGFQDDFSNTSSGWPQEVYKRGDGGTLMEVKYTGGAYMMKIHLDYNNNNNEVMGAVRAPVVLGANSLNYDVAVEHWFARAGDQVVDPEEGKGGLVFSANDDMSTLFVVEWNFEGLCAVNRYSQMTLPAGRYGDPLQTHPIIDWHNCAASGVKAGFDQHNSFRVEVRGNTARIYVTTSGVNNKIGEFTDNSLQTYRRLGLVTGSLYYTPVESRFDNFKLEIFP
ncbi:MAG: hypothetical protein JXB35_12705 [Anaerolineae bacterium]|nr:hypothetical protein [Anaerolineae bacterium]